MHRYQNAMWGHLSPGPCVRAARPRMKETSKGMTLPLHFKNKLRALSVPHVGIDSGSSALEINVTSRSRSMWPRDLSGIQQGAALPASHRLLSPSGGLDHLDLSAFATHCQKLMLAMGSQVATFSTGKWMASPHPHRRCCYNMMVLQLVAAPSIPGYGAELPHVHHVTPREVAFKVAFLL